MSTVLPQIKFVNMLLEVANAGLSKFEYSFLSKALSRTLADVPVENSPFDVVKVTRSSLQTLRWRGRLQSHDSNC